MIIKVMRKVGPPPVSLWDEKVLKTDDDWLLSSRGKKTYKTFSMNHQTNLMTKSSRLKISDEKILQAD